MSATGRSGTSPGAGAAPVDETAPALLSVRDLVVEYPGGRGGPVRVLDGVSLDVPAGSTFAVVGESGCGKTTLARSLVRLLAPTSGRIVFDGTDLAALPERKLRRHRRDIQMVFQNPAASLDPHMRADDVIAEPLRIHHRMGRAARRARALELMELVGLDPAKGRSRPGEWSGGQQQRVAIARALAESPRLLICDEPTSALDVSLQAQVLELLAGLRERFATTYVFISHNLAVVRQISDVVAVMYLGRIVELAPAAQLFAEPRHPYTKALVHVVPDPGRDGPVKPRRAVLAGDLPSPADPPSGCPFRTRCPLAVDACATSVPPLREVRPGHHVACLRTDDVPGWRPEPIRAFASAADRT